MNLNEQIDNAKSEQNIVEVPKNMFDTPIKNEEQQAEKPVDQNNVLINQMFNQAVVHSVSTDPELREEVTDTAKDYTRTKMQKIKTDVNTEYKEAVFNNHKDACESYGFNEKTTPEWAVKMMTLGYNIILGIWLIIGSFTFMPVIFICKKISVGLKKTWIAVLLAVLIYLGVTFIPLLLVLFKK